MKINVEEIFFDGIEELYLNTNVSNNVKFAFQLQMKSNKKYDNYKFYFDLYMKYLNKKFNNDNVKINLFILDKFIKRHKTESVINIDNVLSDFTITSLEIKFIDGKKLIINTPINNKQDKYKDNVNRYLKIINYDEIRNNSIDDIYNNVFDLYMKNAIDNIIVFDSSISSRFELFRR